jgi:hypothetical protein
MIRYCILSVVLFYYLATSAQQSKLNQEISITIQQQSLGDALFLIAEKGNFNISFNPSVISSDSLISKRYQYKKVRAILDDLLPSRIEVVDLGHSILLRDKSLQKSQTKKIELKGVIQDQNGNPVSGALLFEVEGLASTLSKKDGTFKLKEKLQESGRVTFSVTKAECLDTLFQISVKNEPVLIQLKCMPQKNTLINPMPIKEYTLPKVPYVLVPLKVQESSIQSQATLFRKYQFSLVPGIGTNQLLGGLVENQYSLNLVGGYSLGVNKIEMGAGFNIVRSDAKYLQLAGGFNMVGANFEGLQMAGGLNYVGLNYKGVQMAGGINFVGSNFQGVQMSGGVNIVDSTLNGFQISGGYNFARKSNGMQFSGGINSADTLSGFQLAPLNIARVMNGCQIGIINIADSATAPMFGLVNIVGKGGIRSLELSFDLLPITSVALKLGTPRGYNIYAIGVSYVNKLPIWSYGLGLGTQKQTKNGRSIQYETIFNWLVEGVEVDPTNYGLWKTNVSFGNKEFKGIKWSAGPSFNLLVSKMSNTIEGTKSITPYSIYSASNKSLQMDTWIGFNLKFEYNY